MHGNNARWRLHAAWELRFLLARGLLKLPPVPLRIVVRKRKLLRLAEPQVPLADIANDRGSLLDPVMIEQLRGRAMVTPEKRLALDMLLAALADVTRVPRNWRHRQDADGARAWLMDEGTILSARLCCESLSVDYEALREKLARLLAPKEVRA